MKKLLSEIEAFLKRHEMAATTLGIYAAQNGTIVKRLRAGGYVTPETADRVRKFMRETDRRKAAGTGKSK